MSIKLQLVKELVLLRNKNPSNIRIFWIFRLKSFQDFFQLETKSDERE